MFSWSFCSAVLLLLLYIPLNTKSMSGIFKAMSSKYTFWNLLLHVHFYLAIKHSTFTFFISLCFISSYITGHILYLTVIFKYIYMFPGPLNHILNMLGHVWLHLRPHKSPFKMQQMFNAMCHKLSFNTFLSHIGSLLKS